MDRVLYFLIIIVLTLSVLSCAEDERTSLSVEERKEVNDKYKEVLDSINKSLIAECEKNRKEKINKIVDSLKSTRLEEILLITKVKGNEK